MTQRKTISDFMNKKIISVSPDAEISHTVRLLLNGRISGAPVVDAAGELVGFISKKDCFKAALNASYYKQWGGSVSRYMSKTIETLDADLDIVSAAERFLETPYRVFPVMAGGQLVGVISRSDLLSAFFEIAKSGSTT